MATGRSRVTSKFRQGTRNVTGLPTSQGGVVAITERGPVGQRTAVTSAESFKRTFGGITEEGTLAHLMEAFYALAPGAELYVTRTCHYTDITDPNSFTAVAATLMLDTAGAFASAASVDGTIAGPWNLLPAAPDMDITTNLGGPNSAQITYAPAAFSSFVVFPIAPLAGGENMTIDTGDGNGPQTITAAGGEVSLLDMINLINGQLLGGAAKDVGGQLTVETDQHGSGATLTFAAGAPDLAVLLGLAPAVHSGTGNVVDASAATPAELETIIEAADGNVAVTVNGDDTITIATVATGATATLQIGAGSPDLSTILGIDNVLHSGSDAAAQNTLKVDGKTPGTYAHDLEILIATASNGNADYFDLSVMKDSVAQEVFKNVTMDTSALRYVETVINAAGIGSDLIAVTDQGVGAPWSDAKPASGTTGPLAGGDDGLTSLDDNDFIGSSAGATGLYSFDTLETLRLYAIPYRASTAVHAAINTYTESRGNDCYGLHPTPDSPNDSVNTADLMVTWAQSNTFGLTEFAAPPCWPWPAIANPDAAIYTPSNQYVDADDDSLLYVEPSMLKMARFIGNDRQHPDGLYTSAAGLDNDQGILPMVVGLQFFDEVMDAGKRDRLADVNVEPIVKFEGTPYHFDGGDNCKTTGDWPRQWHTRGAIHLVESIKQSWLAYKHVKNTPPMRREAARNAEKFIRLEAPDEAFQVSDGTIAGIPAGQLLYYVDTSDALNPLAVQEAGEFRARIGLGFSYDAKFIEIEVTRPAAA